MWLSLVVHPVKKTTGATGQKKATQPVEGPGASIATQPVEAPSATAVMHPTGQNVSDQIAADRPEVPPPGPASQTYPSVISEVQSPDPTGQPVAVKKSQATSLTSTAAPSSDQAFPTHVG